MQILIERFLGPAAADEKKDFFQIFFLKRISKNTIFCVRSPLTRCPFLFIIHLYFMLAKKKPQKNRKNLNETQRVEQAALAYN